MLVLLGFAVLAGRGHRPVAVRAAGAARAAVGRRRRRPAPAAGHRARAVDHVHGDDRRRREGRRRRRARQRPAARRGDRRAARVRRGAAAAGHRRPHRGAAVAPGALRPALARRRLLVGAARRRRARLRLHAVREPDPRGRHLGQRGERQNGRDRARLRARLGGRAARADARRPASVRPRAQGRARPAAAARARHDHDPHGGRDHRQPRRQLRPVRRAAHPRRQPDGVAGVLGNGHQPPARNQRASAEVRARQRLLGVRRLGIEREGGAGERQPGDAAGRRARPAEARPGAGIHRNAGLVQHARRAAAVARRRCTGASCWSTSGRTRASTASARCPT